MREETNHTRHGNSHGNVHRTKKSATFLIVFATAALLASCAEETTGNGGGNTESSAAAPSGTTMEGATSGTTGSTTGGTTMSGAMMGGTTTGATTSGTTMGTTMSGGMMGGTTMSGTTFGSSTMSTTTGPIAGTTSGTTSGGGITSGGTLTSVQSIVSESDKASLVGRQVQLDGVDVRNSIGNTGFLAGSSGADQVFVVPGGGANVQQGQTANIEGTLREVPGISEAQQQFGVGETAAALLQSQVVYLDARQVQ